MPVTEEKQLGFIVNPAGFPEVKMDFPLAPGPFEPTWSSIDKNYPKAYVHPSESDYKT